MKGYEFMNKTGILINKMIEYYKGDRKRINHFLKVFSYAKAIGESETDDEQLLYILETAAVTHDIGIKISEEKYNSSSGHYQQQEGPSIARKMLSELNYDNETIERVCYLIAHHHTYNNISGLDYQILVEADFLVNIDEENMSTDAVKNIKKNIFKTKSGMNMLSYLFGV